MFNKMSHYKLTMLGYLHGHQKPHESSSPRVSTLEVARCHRPKSCRSGPALTADGGQHHAGALSEGMNGAIVGRILSVIMWEKRDITPFCHLKFQYT